VNSVADNEVINYHMTYELTESWPRAIAIPAFVSVEESCILDKGTVSAFYHKRIAIHMKLPRSEATRGISYGAGKIQVSAKDRIEYPVKLSHRSECQFIRQASNNTRSSPVLRTAVRMNVSTLKVQRALR